MPDHGLCRSKCVARGVRIIGRRCRRHDIEWHALPIGDKGHAPDTRNIPRLPVDSATRFLDAPGARVDIIDTDITSPARGRAAGEHFRRQRQYAAYAVTIYGYLPVIHVRLTATGEIPADQRTIKGLCGIGIACHQFIPDEITLLVRHVPAPYFSRVTTGSKPP